MSPGKAFETPALILLYTCTHMRCRINSFIKTENIQSFKQHSSAFFIHPSTFMALMSTKWAYDSPRIISSSLHLSLHMPAFKLGTCRWLLRIISTWTTASKVSVNTETSFSQTLHQHREEGTDPKYEEFSTEMNVWCKSLTEKQKICPVPCRWHQKTGHEPPYCSYGLSTDKKILPYIVCNLNQRF